jgi:hypothetical protein
MEGHRRFAGRDVVGALARLDGYGPPPSVNLTRSN